MSRLPIQTPDTAQPQAKPRIEAAIRNNGFLPNLIGVLANSPAALQMYQDVGAINATTSLSPFEREVVQITAAVANGCGYCVHSHTARFVRSSKTAALPGYREQFKLLTAICRLSMHDERFLVQDAPGGQTQTACFRAASQDATDPGHRVQLAFATASRVLNWP